MPVNDENEIELFFEFGFWGFVLPPFLFVFLTWNDSAFDNVTIFFPILSILFAALIIIPSLAVYK